MPTTRTHVSAINTWVLVAEDVTDCQIEPARDTLGCVGVCEMVNHDAGAPSSLEKASDFDERGRQMHSAVASDVWVQYLNSAGYVLTRT